MSKQYSIVTHGCQMNEHDSERIAGLLEADGYSVTDDQSDADVIVVNTCCIRENADNKLYGALGNMKRLKDANPELQIMVGGCLAQKDQELVRQRAGHVDVVFGTHNVHRATQLLEQSRSGGPITEIWEAADPDEAFASALPEKPDLDYKAWLTIQVGCDNSCAFCIVPSVRGEEISRPPADIVAEAERLAARGVTELTLLGQNVNSYGRDLAIAARRAGDAEVRLRPAFAELLRSVAAVEGIRRVRYTSPHPKDMTSDVFEAMADTPEVMPHLHFPLQSGSDRILKAMHRGYSAERYLQKLAQARATIPDLAVTTDIIVGFPGETEDDFSQTLALAAEAQFDHAFTFVYSPRKGTEAAELTDHFCDPDEVKDRFARLRVVIERAAIARQTARVGLIEDVIIEGPSKTNPERITGRTPQNKLVHFPKPDGSLRVGSYATVKVTEAFASYLIGELVEVTARSTHRTRIPVLSSAR